MESARHAFADQHAFVVRAVRGVLGDPALAEDAAQEAWMRALRPGGTTTIGWLVTAARNIGLDQRRSRAAREARERRRALDRGEVVADASDGALERVERRQRVASTVLALAEPLRSVVLLRYEEGLTAVEIARRTGVDEATVRRRLARAHEELRRRLDREFGDRQAWAALGAPLLGAGVSRVGVAVALTLALGAAGLGWLTRPMGRAAQPEMVAPVTPAAMLVDASAALEPAGAARARVAVAAATQETAPSAVPDERERLLAQAELWDRARFDDYERATFSFQHGRRDDPELEVTRNDWDLLFTNGAFDVNTVVDDHSVIAALGAVDPRRLAESLPAPLVWSDARDSRAPIFARTTHAYLVLSRDSDTDLATVFQVVEFDGDRVVLDWYTTDGTGRAQGSFRDDGEGEPLVRTLARIRGAWRAARPLRDGVVRMQVQYRGNGNPCEVDLSGDAIAYVDRVVPAPFDLGVPPGEPYESVAYANGGFLPEGHAFRVTSVELRRVRAAGAERLPQPTVTVGGRVVPLCRVGDPAPYERDGARPAPELLRFDDSERDTWTGELFVLPGEEPRTSLEVEEPGGVEVVLRGAVVPHALDPNRGFGGANEGFFVTPPYVPPPVPALTRPRAVLQLRAGAQGGNTSTLDLLGRESRVEHVRAERLDLAVPPRMSDPSEAFVEGGSVPEGKVFVITHVTWYGSAAGDTNGGGLVALRVGDVQVLSVERSDEPLRGQWTGAVPIARGEEHRVKLSIANSSFAHVELEGELRDAPKVGAPR